jgi:hypothetical protein
MVTQISLTPELISDCTAPSANGWWLAALFNWNDINRADPWGTEMEKSTSPESAAVLKGPATPVTGDMLGPVTL